MDNVPSSSKSPPTSHSNLQDSWTYLGVSLPKSDVAVNSATKSFTTYIRPRDVEKALGAVPGKEKIYRCKLCEYTSRFQNGLDYHMKKQHDQGEKYICTVCNYSCYLKQNLTQHMRQHTGEKPFACEFCSNYSSASKAGLRYHVRTKHDQKSLISCTVCGYKAYNTHILTQHLRKHSGVKPFTCSVCCNNFGTKTSLKHHIRSKHPVSSSDSPVPDLPRIDKSEIEKLNLSQLFNS
jgi:hypothetical protein